MSASNVYEIEKSILPSAHISRVPYPKGKKQDSIT